MNAVARVRLDTKSPVPVYHQIEEALRELLGTPALPAGQRLPTERAIAGMLGVSRQTVRQALSRLEREGLISRRQGAGTFVSEPRLESGLRVLRGFTSEISARGVRVRSQIHEFGLAQPPPAVASQLNVDAETDAAIRLRRTRLVDGVPATVEEVWLPAHLCRPLLALDLTDRSLYTALRTVVGVEPATATERLTATALNDFEARQLDQKAGSPALLVERTSRDVTGQCIEVVSSVLRADRFAFTAELDLEREPLLQPDSFATSAD